MFLTSTACGSKDGGNSVTAEEVCGGLSPTAAESMEKVTAARRFDRSSVMDDTDKFVNSLLPLLESNRKEIVEFCRITPRESGKPPVPRVSFQPTDHKSIPPDPEDEIIGEEKFPIALQAISTYTGADIYFECRTSDLTIEEGKEPVVRANFSYGHRALRGEGGLDAPWMNMDILQHVARNVAGHLGCENHGDIPKRDKPW
ncbi:hypothetical protein [Streptomyces macrosporus]|uniref:hypothetical protein n=1 Tax=Streptomyces macrosporus TaxID=44032 RepID=UPI0031DAEA5E